MNLQLFLLFISLISLSFSSSIPHNSSSQNLDEIFNSFTNRHKISFKSKTDETLRRKIFNEKYQKIQEHNKKFENGEESFKEDLNEFSVLTFDEMKKLTLGELGEPKKDHPLASEHLRRKRDTTELPAEWDWNAKGYVRPVKHQGNCGSCYAFSAIGAIESRMQIVHNISTDLSEQEALECTNRCDGGWPYSVFDYAKNSNGCTADTTKPYTATTISNCMTSSSRVPESKVQSYLGVPSNEADMRFYLYDKGPLSAVMKVYENFYYYSSGVYSSASGSFVGDHAVLIVGYGSENGIDYWMVKNSWGTGWGLSGYIKIKRGVNLCSLENYFVTYPEV